MSLFLTFSASMASTYLCSIQYCSTPAALPAISELRLGKPKAESPPPEEPPPSALLRLLLPESLFDRPDLRASDSPEAALTVPAAATPAMSKGARIKRRKR